MANGQASAALTKRRALCGLAHAALGGREFKGQGLRSRVGGSRLPACTWPCRPHRSLPDFHDAAHPQSIIGAPACRGQCRPAELRANAATWLRCRWQEELGALALVSLQGLAQRMVPCGLASHGTMGASACSQPCLGA